MLASNTIGIDVGAEEQVRGGLKYKWRTGHSTPSPAAPLRQKLYMTFLKAVFSHSNAILNLSLHNLKV